MKGSNLKSKLILGSILLLGMCFVLGMVAMMSVPVQAHSIQNDVGQSEESDLAPAENSACLVCHGTPDKTLAFPNGDTTSISINAIDFSASVHSSLSCNTCHPTIKAYPHPTLVAQDKREYTLQYKDSCKECHADKFNLIQDSVHSQALASGNKNAPVCSDCHDPHRQGLIKDDKGNLLLSAKVQIPGTCAKCHSAIFTEYANSVHGKGVLEANNPDVPTCTSCHGVHSIDNPTTAARASLTPVPSPTRLSIIAPPRSVHRRQGRPSAPPADTARRYGPTPWIWVVGEYSWCASR